MSSRKVGEIGVVVGRFQIPELHEGHLQFLDEVHSMHNKVIVFLGITKVLGSKRNPLDFDSRRKMIQESYPDAIVLPISDQRCDHKWSKELDRKIREVCPAGDVVLYGNRDCFMTHYYGVFQTVELEQKVFVSGTQVRREAALKANGSIDFRRGAIYASFNRYPIAYGTTDIAVINYKTGEVLLGRKGPESKLRFPGGFLNPGETHNAGALRELKEETGGDMEVDKNLSFVGSFVVDDWRYRNEDDKITTILFATEYLWGPIRATDDLDAVAWVKLDTLNVEEQIMEEHWPLAEALLKFYHAVLFARTTKNNGRNAVKETK